MGGKTSKTSAKAANTAAAKRIDKKIAGLGDWRGERLADIRRKLFNAGLEGTTWRAIDFREGDKIDRRALKALLREAVDYNTRHAVPKSKGSRASTRPSCDREAAHAGRQCGNRGGVAATMLLGPRRT